MSASVARLADRNAFDFLARPWSGMSSPVQNLRTRRHTEVKEYNAPVVQVATKPTRAGPSTAAAATHLPPAITSAPSALEDALALREFIDAERLIEREVLREICDSEDRAEAGRAQELLEFLDIEDAVKEAAAVDEFICIEDAVEEEAAVLQYVAIEYEAEHGCVLPWHEGEHFCIKDGELLEAPIKSPLGDAPVSTIEDAASRSLRGSPETATSFLSMAPCESAHGSESEAFAATASDALTAPEGCASPSLSSSASTTTALRRKLPDLALNLDAMTAWWGEDFVGAAADAGASATPAPLEVLSSPCSCDGAAPDVRAAHDGPRCDAPVTRLSSSAPMNFGLEPLTLAPSGDDRDSSAPIAQFATY